MQLAQDTKKVIRSGQFQESKFKIEASAKAFQILSSRLYSSEFKAIVRELCTNASDAHAAAGIPDKPIEVHSPTIMDSNFWVQDSGNGIDPDEFEKIYTTYFYSTKTDTDDQVGCFGLGSKSPFAYTQQFSVENCYKGTKYTYTCFINENGEPSVTLLTKVPTDRSGVKVSFPVKSQNCYNFQQAIVDVLQWFDLTPKCNVMIENKSFTETSKHFGYQNMGHDYGIRMGQVVYPVNDEYFSDYVPAKTIFNVNIGDVDITPSREALEYRKRTIDTLNRLIKKYADEFDAKFEDIKNDTSMSEFKKFQAVHAIFNAEGAKSSVRVKKINELFPNIVNMNTFARVDQGKFESGIYSYIQSSWRNKLENSNYGVVLSYDTIFLIKDKSARINLKIEKILNDYKKENHARGNVLVIGAKDADTFISMYNLNKEDVIYASEYELDKTTTASIAPSRNCCHLVCQHGTYKKESTKIGKDEKDGYWVDEEEISLMLKYQASSNFRNFLSIYKQKGSPKLYIFTKNQYESLKISQKNFTNFLDMAVKELKDNEAEVVDHIAHDSIRTQRHERAMQVGEMTKSNNLFKDYFKFHSSRANDNSKSSYYEGMTSLIMHHDNNCYEDFRKKINDKVNQLQVIREQAEKKYPLTKVLLDNGNFHDIIDDVVNYVDMMTEGENK